MMMMMFTFTNLCNLRNIYKGMDRVVRSEASDGVTVAELDTFIGKAITAASTAVELLSSSSSSSTSRLFVKIGTILMVNLV
jgi:hypothetical protein